MKSKNKNIVVIIQARMGSSRLPGKVLMKAGGKPLLGHLIDRVKVATLIDKIVVSTTTEGLDDEIVEYCKYRNIDYYRGSETNVLSRYYNTSLKSKADFIIRICADSPLIDPTLIDEMLEEYFSFVETPDYYSNTINQSYPVGMNIEIFSHFALEQAHIFSKKNFELEHVTPYIYTHQEKFNICEKHMHPNLSHLRLTVDEEEDYKAVKLILEDLCQDLNTYTLNDLVGFLEDNPDIVKINSHIKQNNNNFI